MLKEFSREQKDLFIEYIQDPSKHIVWGRDNLKAYTAWYGPIYNLEKLGDFENRRLLLAHHAEQINANFICCRIFPGALEFKDQKSKFLFMLKYF